VKNSFTLQHKPGITLATVLLVARDADTVRTENAHLFYIFSKTTT